MKRFTHGVMVVDPNVIDEDGNSPVIHFIGCWEEPTETDIEHFREELRTDPDFELREMADTLEYLIATEDCIKHFNDMVEKDGAFNQEINLN